VKEFEPLIFVNVMPDWFGYQFQRITGRKKPAPAGRQFVRCQAVKRAKPIFKS